MSGLKYELTDTRHPSNSTLRQIRALRDIPHFDAQAGDLGGWIEAEKNLVQSGNAWVYGDARVYGNARVSGDAWVYGDARIETHRDILWLTPVGSENGTLTAYRTADGVGVTRGCFSGTLDEFETAVQDTHRDNKYAQEYRAAIALIRGRFGVLA